jgi:hypothetical protein
MGTNCILESKILFEKRAQNVNKCNQARELEVDGHDALINRGAATARVSGALTRGFHQSNQTILFSLPQRSDRAQSRTGHFDGCI